MVLSHITFTTLSSAMCIAASNPEAGSTGWKEKVAKARGEVIRQFCGKEEIVSIQSCIDEKTYTQQEILTDVLLGFEGEKSIMNGNGTETIEDFTTPQDGKHYTTQLSQMIGPDYSAKTNIYFVLNHKLSFRLFIHDPKYFLINTNTLEFPIIYIKTQKSTTPNYYYKLFLTEVEELDLPEDPCNTDPDYNFQACMKEILSSQVGCRTKTSSHTLLLMTTPLLITSTDLP